MPLSSVQFLSLVVFNLFSSFSSSSSMLFIVSPPLVPSPETAWDAGGDGLIDDGIIR